jgi:hypothetical protein
MAAGTSFPLSLFPSPLFLALGQKWGIHWINIDRTHLGGTVPEWTYRRIAGKEEEGACADLPGHGDADAAFAWNGNEMSTETGANSENPHWQPLTNIPEYQSMTNGR